MNSACLRTSGAARREARAYGACGFFIPASRARLRYVAPYHEACARLAGHAGQGTLTRLMNRLWIGRNSMAG